MLVPFMLGLCVAPTAAESGHAAVMDFMTRANVGTAVLVATVHAFASLVAGIGMAWAVYRYLGLPFLRQAWLNLDAVWGASLVLAGATGMLPAS
jgi:hypothetical protein